MKLLTILMEKPWLTPDYDVNQVNSVQNDQSKIGKTALLFFLMVITILFLLITVTFLTRSQYYDFQALAGQPWLPFTQPKQLWLNTASLIVASLTLQLAVMYSKKMKVDVSLIFVSFATVFSCLFIIGQLLVWQKLTNTGYFIDSNPANSYFYLYTGLHGLHLFGGIFALVRVLAVFFRRTDPKRFSKNLSLCAVYWHYLLLVWILLFLLLTATEDTYKTIALICGF